MCAYVCDICDTMNSLKINKSVVSLKKIDAFKNVLIYLGLRWVFGVAKGGLPRRCLSLVKNLLPK